MELFLKERCQPVVAWRRFRLAGAGQYGCTS